MTAALSSNERIHQQTLVFNAETKDKTLTSEPFALRGRASNVTIEITTNLNNQWIYLELALIERNTGASVAINRELGYYQGVDEGERWSEGSASDEAVLSAIPAGLYYLSVEGEWPPTAQAVVCTFMAFPRCAQLEQFLSGAPGIKVIPDACPLAGLGA